MKISQMIEELKSIHAAFGDLPCVGGYISDDTPPRKFVVLDEFDVETNDPVKAFSIFIQG